MNHDYKLKFEQMRESSPGRSEDGGEDQRYYNAGYSRNVVFVQINGDCDAFNYAYLVKLKYNVEESAIYLHFTSDTVKLAGFGLLPLFYELFDQRNRIVHCVDTRYEQLENAEMAVTEITIIKNA